MLPQSFWRQIEGSILDGKVRVLQLVPGEREGTFAAEPLDAELFGGARNLTVRFLRSSSEPQLERYLEASFLEHPNLLRVFGTGTFEFGGTPLTYAVLERAEGTLGEIENRGPLTTEETKDLGLQLIAALQYLHQRDLVYCNLDPATVVRAGDQWKLSEYSQLRLAGKGYSGETRRMLAISAGTPPEAWDGIVSPAWDAWSLAWLLAGAVSERRPAGREANGARSTARRPLPEPFAAMISECLNANPAERCGLTRIAELLRGAPAGRQPVLAGEVSPPERATGWHGSGADVPQKRPWFRRINAKQALATALAFVGGFILVATLAYHPNAGQQPAPVAASAPAPAAGTTKPFNGEADRSMARPVSTREAGLLGVLQKWTHASRTRNLDEQISCYAPVVDTFYGAHGVSPAYIRRERAQALSKVGDVEKFDIDNVHVQMNGPEAATVTFDKTWAFAGRSHYSGKVREQMGMRRINGQWRISSERDVHVYRRPTTTPITAES